MEIPMNDECKVIFARGYCLNTIAYCAEMYWKLAANEETVTGEIGRHRLYIAMLREKHIADVCLDILTVMNDRG